MIERSLVSQLTNRMKEPRHFIQIVTGPRQTGKTTAVTQLQEHLQVPFHYVSADDPVFSTPEWLIQEWMAAREMSTASERGAILIVDEVQNVHLWSAYVKKLWDEDTRLGTPLKVILTGSSALLLSKGMTESLMGRFEVFFSPHWSLSEMRDAFDYSLDEFLFFGGYPGSAPIHDDTARWRRYMETSIVTPTISRDIIQLEEVRKPALMNELFYLGATYSAQELSFAKVAGRLQEKGTIPTLIHYLNLLSSAGMVTGLEKYSANPINARRSTPRFMVYDTSLMMYASKKEPSQLSADKTYRGHVVESAVGAYLLARSEEEGFEVFWWRDAASEVDFVIRKGEALTAFEVKSGAIKGVGGSLEFVKRYPGASYRVIGDTSTPLEEFLLGKIRLFD